MSIHTTKNDRYEVRWREGGRQRSQAFDKKTDAKLFEAELLKKKKDKELGVAPRQDMYFRDLCGDWIMNHAAVDKSYTQYRKDESAIKRLFLPLWGDKLCSEISPDDVKTLRTQLLSSTLKRKSVKNYMMLLHSIFRRGVREKMISHNPAEGSSDVKVERQPFFFWTRAEGNKFLSWAHDNRPDLHFIVSLLLSTGLRRGEAAALTVGDIDFERGQIRVERAYDFEAKKTKPPKNGRARYIPINGHLKHILRPLRGKKADEKVLPEGVDFQHLGARELQKACELAGVSKMTVHGLRHTFASHLVMGGKDLRTVMELMGHSNLTTTQRYSHLSPDHLQSATEILPWE